MAMYDVYVNCGCFRRNAHYVLREMLAAAKHSGTRKDFTCVANCL